MVGEPNSRAACPLGWSAEDRRGHWLTDRHTFRPDWHVALITETVWVHDEPGPRRGGLILAVQRCITREDDESQ
jgi:hypothetical protein